MRVELAVDHEVEEDRIFYCCRHLDFEVFPDEPEQSADAGKGLPDTDVWDGELVCWIASYAVRKGDSLVGSIRVINDLNDEDISRLGVDVIEKMKQLIKEILTKHFGEEPKIEWPVSNVETPGEGKHEPEA